MPRSRDWARWSVKVALAKSIVQTARLPRPPGRARAPRRPLILGYHRVVDDFASAARTDLPSMLISRAMFERHLEWLAKRFRFVDLDEIGAHVASGRPFDEPVVAITFDDGYQEVYDHASPTLTRMGIPAAMFVVTGLVGRDVWQIHDKLYFLLARAFRRWRHPRRELRGLLTALDLRASEVFSRRAATSTPLLAVAALLPTLAHADIDRVLAALGDEDGDAAHQFPRAVTWQMLADMRRDGFTIGSHTETHVSLPVETPQTVLAELAGSKRSIEQHLGGTVTHFAYPDGQFTPAVVDAVAASGYGYAYTTCAHEDPSRPALTLERLLLWEGSSVNPAGRFSPSILDCQTRNLWPPAHWCHRVHHP